MSLYSGKHLARRGYQGGIVGKIGGLVKRGAGLVARTTGKFAPGPSGAVLRGVGGLLNPPQILKGQPLRKLPLLPGGGMALQMDLGAAGGKKKKRRTMNFGNGRAIRRAARRLEGAEKMFRKVFSIRHGKAPTKITPKRGR